MADRTLLNYGVVSGSYGDVPFDNSKTTEVAVTLTDIGFTKSADQSIWFDGDLVYTLTFDNSTGDSALNNLIIQDTLDKTKFLFTAGSVAVQLDDGATVTDLILDTDYSVVLAADTPDASNDLLTISFLTGGAIESIPVGSIVTVTFRGSKVSA